MTHKVMRLKPRTLPYTSVNKDTPSLERSVAAIKGMLQKFKCQQFNVHEDMRGEHPFITMRFERLGKIYMIEFPVTYLNDKLEMRIAGRIMFHYVKALLMAVELEYLDFSQTMMGFRALPRPDGSMITLQEAYDVAGDTLPAAGFDIRLALPRGGDHD